MVPRAHQVDHALGADLGVQAFDEVGALRGDAPVAFAARAALALVAAQGDERRRGDVDRVGAQRDRAHDVGGAADGAARDHAHRGAEPLLAQPVVDGGQGELDGDAHVVADALGRGTRSSAESVDRDDVGARPRDAARDGGDVVHGGDLHRHGLGVAGRLLQREDELAQILDRVDVVMRRWADRVGALGDHAGPRHLGVDLLAGQVPADARLGALADLDLDRGPGGEVLGRHAEAPRRHLDDGVIRVGFQAPVEAALAGVEVRPQLLGGHRERGLRVKRDGAEAHRREHERHVELDLRRKLRDDRALALVDPERVGART